MNYEHKAIGEAEYQDNQELIHKDIIRLIESQEPEQRPVRRSLFMSSLVRWNPNSIQRGLEFLTGKPNGIKKISSHDPLGEDYYNLI